MTTALQRLQSFTLNDRMIASGWVLSSGEPSTRVSTRPGADAGEELLPGIFPTSRASAWLHGALKVSKP